MTRVFIAGHRGMVGQALIRALAVDSEVEIITRTRGELDLTDQLAVRTFFATNKIDQVYLAAAKVGGIEANNTYPAQFIYENLMIQTNIIHQAFEAGVRRLLFLGSSCIYPKFANQPMSEEELLTGRLEPTNEPYAIAKIAGLKMCESYNRQFGQSDGVDFRCVMPTNLYGQGDNYHPKNSHVVPALIRRFYEATESAKSSVTIWGSGTPRREFLHVDDMASASIFVMNLPKLTYASLTTPMQSHINVGYGSDVTIAELAQMIACATGFNGRIEFDKSKPDGPKQKLMNSNKIRKLGWSPRISLSDGLKATVDLYKAERSFAI